MKTFKNLTALLGMAVLTACSHTAPIEGSWMQPVPGMADMKQGFTLAANGTASSVNMATLQYEAWKQEGNLLLLTGISKGNRQDIPFTDTLTIEKLTSDSLILRKGELALKYAKAEVIPAAKLTPAKQIMTVKGELVIGHEARTFKAEGNSTEYWVADETGELLQKYDELTGGIKNGTPVYAELEVADLGKSDEGFAANYTSVYQVVKINRIALK